MESLCCGQLINKWFSINPELTRKTDLVIDKNAPLPNSLNTKLCINGVPGVIYQEDCSVSTERNIQAKKRKENNSVLLDKQNIKQQHKRIDNLKARIEQLEKFTKN